MTDVTGVSGRGAASGCGTRAGSSSTWTAPSRSATGSTTGSPRCRARSSCCAGSAARGLPYVVFTNGTNRSPAHFAAVLRDARARRARRADDDAGLQRGRHVHQARLQAGHGARRRRADRAAARRPGIEVVPPVEAAPDTRPCGRPPDVDAVLVGWFREFTMSHLEAACHAVWSGAALYCASETPFFAAAGGRALGTSRAISAMIRSVTGCRADGHRQAVARRAARRGRPGSASPRGTWWWSATTRCSRCRWRTAATRSRSRCRPAWPGPDAYDHLPPAKRPHLHLRGVDELLSLCAAHQ